MRTLAMIFPSVAIIGIDIGAKNVLSEMRKRARVLTLR